MQIVTPLSDSGGKKANATALGSLIPTSAAACCMNYLDSGGKWLPWHPEMANLSGRVDSIEKATKCLVAMAWICRSTGRDWAGRACPETETATRASPFYGKLVSGCKLRRLRGTLPGAMQIAKSSQSQCLTGNVVTRRAVIAFGTEGRGLIELLYCFFFLQRTWSMV